MKSKHIAILIIIVLILNVVPVFAQSDIPQREDIDTEYKWNLEDIYTSIDAWEADYDFIVNNLAKFNYYNGRLGKSGKEILNYFKLNEETSIAFWNLYVYSHLQKDSDTRDSEFQALADRAGALYTKYGEATAFVEPELQKLSEKQIKKFISKTKGLEIYQHYFDNLVRQRAHTLSEKEENLLAMAGDLYQGPQSIYNSLTMTDLVFPKIINDEGDSVRLTRGRYALFLLSKDRELRKRAFLARNKAYEQIINTNAKVFDSSLKKDLFLTRARNYNSTLERTLSYDNIPVDVYDNLIKTVFDHAGSLNRYMELRKKVLGLDEIHLYDTSVPIVEDVDVKVPYEEAKNILAKAFAPLGEEYVSTIKKALNSRWIDVYETEGKTAGAYSWGTYSSHPYMLMNYNGTMDHMFTLAHELGHAMHSHYSNQNQPYATADYPLFLAEVASTFNENLLLNYLMKNTEDENQKLALIDQWIDNFIGTVITQVRFAEFEQAAHKMVQEGIPVTAESLNKVVLDFDQKWYGESTVVGDGYELTWGRIPHYYRAFYVYKYATSFCASTALAKRVIDGEEGAIENYMTFLQSGGSDYPIEILKKAGVDMSSPEPVEQAMQLFDSLVIQMEELLLNQ